MNKENALELIDYKGHQIGLFYDSDPENPRDWDNVGTFYNNNDKYISPDGKSIEDLMEMAGQNRDDEVIRFNVIRKKFYCLKVWLYDHSGVVLRTGNSNPWGNGYMSWDSCLFGAIAVSKEKAKELYGYKRACKSLEKKVLEALESEVKTYSQFMNGEVYAYVVEDAQGEEIDSCHGWYDKEEAINEAKGMVDYCVDGK